MHSTVENFGYAGTLTQELIDFARRQAINDSLHKRLERRAEDRVPLFVPVVAVPVDEQVEPIDDFFEAIARDVTSSSIGLLHAEQLEHSQLAIHFELEAQEVDLLIDIIWRSPLGPFYGSAGTYVKKLARFPVDFGQA